VHSPITACPFVRLSELQQLEPAWYRATAASQVKHYCIGAAYRRRRTEMGGERGTAGRLTAWRCVGGC
jgi:hypothetical protein